MCDSHAKLKLPPASAQWRHNPSTGAGLNWAGGLSWTGLGWAELLGAPGHCQGKQSECKSKESCSGKPLQCSSPHLTLAKTL